MPIFTGRTPTTDMNTPDEHGRESRDNLHIPIRNLRASCLFALSLSVWRLEIRYTIAFRLIDS